MAGGLLLWPFVMLLGVMSPGPDFAVVVRNSIASAGYLRGVVTAIGVATGIFLWVFATSFGLIGVLSAFPGVFLAIRIAGALYLAYLGIRALAAMLQHSASTDDKDLANPAPQPHFSAFRDGVVCNVLNPKAAVWFVALLPQFLASSPDIGRVLVLASIASAVAVVWLGSLAMLVSAVRRAFAKPSVRRSLDGLTGLALIGCGIRVAFST